MRLSHFSALLPAEITVFSGGKSARTAIGPGPRNKSLHLGFLHPICVRELILALAGIILYL
jgi:hypothetical protein